MKCNACWRELEGRGIATTCGHVFCTEDASKILNSDSACPLCDQILSRSHMKSVDLNPNDDWTNMVMAGVPPHCIMKSAFKGVTFWIGQKDVESQLTESKARQMQEKYKGVHAQLMQKLEQAHGAYQKAMKKIQALEYEKESLMKDKSELEEKYSDKSRQKRKLEEMYESLRGEYEKLKRNGGASPAQQAMRQQFEPTSESTEFWHPQKRTTFSSTADEFGAASSALAPPRRAIGMRQTSPFKASASDMFAPPPPPHHPHAHAPPSNNPSNTLRNLLLSPLKRPPSKLRPGLKGL